MAKILSKTGITSGSKVEAWHVTQSIDAFTGVEAYDITLSGSLTVTGSVILSQPINVNFSGTALSSTTSSYSTSSKNIAYAITTSQANNQTICLQVQHFQSNLTQNTTYFMGGGTITTVGSFNPLSVTGLPAAGTLSPVSGRIISASVTTTCSTTGTFISKLILGLDDYTTFTFENDVLYNDTIVSFNEDVNLNITAGQRIMFQIDTKTGTNPTGVIHNINLYIKS
jgi:hypothetical protein